MESYQRECRRRRGRKKHIPLVEYDEKKLLKLKFRMFMRTILDENIPESKTSFPVDLYLAFPINQSPKFPLATTVPGLKGPNIECSHGFA